MAIRLRRFLSLVLVAQVVLSLSAAAMKFMGTCGSCAGKGIVEGSIALAGAGFYALLLLAAIRGNIGPVFRLGITLAFSVQAGLAVAMVQARSFCPICLATAGLSVVLFGSLLLTRAIPVSAGAVLAISLAVATNVVARRFVAAAPLPGLARVMPPKSDSGPLRILALTESGCPYCRTLEGEYVPALEAEFGSSIEFSKRDASPFPGLPVPTIVVEGSVPRVFQGLPPYATLRQAVRDGLSERRNELPATVLPEPR